MPTLSPGFLQTPDDDTERLWVKHRYDDVALAADMEIYKAIESLDKKDDTQWLTYWVVFAFLNVIEFASELILAWFPIYYLCKFVFLLYLHLPMTMGAEKLYTQLVAPVMHKLKGHVASIEPRT
ncbi:TB2/DP1, HVA22 family [Trichuris suis]|nr:TB2/DP1, HVA22 family [Trichuris suis]